MRSDGQGEHHDLEERLTVAVSCVPEWFLARGITEYVVWCVHQALGRWNHFYDLENSAAVQ